MIPKLPKTANDPGALLKGTCLSSTGACLPEIYLLGGLPRQGRTKTGVHARFILTGR